jgi:type IV pilus assembly protein PilE
LAGEVPGPASKDHPMTRPARRDEGFTLIELMIVVVIIGILAAIAIPKFNGVSSASKEAEATPILRQIYTLQERYKQSKDSFASDFSDLEGGAAQFNSSNFKYYTFTVQATATSFDACATPQDPTKGLKTYVVNQSGVVQQGTCPF